MNGRRGCQCSDHDAGGCAFAPSDDVCSCACHGSAPDPTRLDPPVRIRLGDAIGGPEWPRILGHLLRVTGAIDDLGRVHGEHEAAAARAFEKLPDVVLLLTHLDAEGRPTFELARDA